MEHKGKIVAYIEYQNGIPHFAITVNDSGGMTHWDFEIFYGDTKNIRYYESGSGGNISSFDSPKYIDGLNGCYYWMSNVASFKDKPKNIKAINEPLIITGYNGTSKNPFDPIVSEETYSLDYCDRCQHWDNEYCRQHQFEDENDDYVLKYIDDKSLVE